MYVAGYTKTLQIHLMRSTFSICNQKLNVTGIKFLFHKVFLVQIHFILDALVIIYINRHNRY